MTEQEWDEHEYNKQRGSCWPLIATAILAAAAVIILLTRGRR